MKNTSRRLCSVAQRLQQHLQQQQQQQQHRSMLHTQRSFITTGSRRMSRLSFGPRVITSQESNYNNVTCHTFATLTSTHNNNNHHHHHNSNKSNSMMNTSQDVASTALLLTRQLYMWGTDTKGCLSVIGGGGYNDATSSSSTRSTWDVPALVDWNDHLHLDNDDYDTIGSIQQVVCGPADTAWITTTGRCWVMGRNAHGMLGVGHTQPVTKPTEVILPRYANETTPLRRIVHVAFGPEMAAFVDDGGDLYTSGHGGSTFSGLGALGHGHVAAGSNLLLPTLVESLIQDDCYVQQVQWGESHMTVLTTEGEVLTCGAGSYGRLGNFQTVDQLYLEPTELLSDRSVTAISGGKSFTLALTEDGTVYGWGRNHKGQLGTGLGLAVDMYAMQAVPEPIDTAEFATRTMVQIAAGHSHAACISSDGECFWWGMAQHLEPVRVEALLHTPITAVACGHDYTLALDVHGRLYSWGIGKTGVLGHGPSIRLLNQPERVDVGVVVAAAQLDGIESQHNQNQPKVVQIAAGYKHAACLVAPPPPPDQPGLSKS